jgi:hypothetical protein
MEKKNLEAKLEELKTRRFLINMIDRWSLQDSRDYAAVSAEIKELEAKLAQM